MNIKFWLILNEEHHSQDVVSLVWFSLSFYIYDGTPTIPTLFIMILHLAENGISFAFTSLSWKLWLEQNNSLKNLACKTKIPPILFVLDYSGNQVDPNNHSYREPCNLTNLQGCQQEHLWQLTMLPFQISHTHTPSATCEPGITVCQLCNSEQIQESP